MGDPGLNRPHGGKVEARTLRSKGFAGKVHAHV